MSVSYSMRLEGLSRTTTFRLTTLYSMVFALGVIALLWMIYIQSAGFLTARVDGILQTEANAVAALPRSGLRQRIIDDLAINGNEINAFGLFAADGSWLAGNVSTIPPQLRIDGPPLEVEPSIVFRASARPYWTAFGER